MMSEPAALYPGARRESLSVLTKTQLTPSMYVLMEQRISEGGYGGQAEYLRALVRADLDAWASHKLSAPGPAPERPETGHIPY